MEHFNTLHLFLAYGGLLLHTIIKLAENPCSGLKCFNKKEILVTLASVISIPIILIICTDTSMKDILPINHVTAFLAGYQTQSILKTIGSIGGKFNKTKDI